MSDHPPDLLLRHLGLPRFMVGKEAKDQVGGTREEVHQGSGDEREAQHGFRDPGREGLGIPESHPFGNELSEDQGHVGDGQDGENHGHFIRHPRRQAE